MREDVKKVKELGETIGYGHMMSIATSLWRKNLKEKGYPVVAAFVTTCLPFMKDDDRKNAENTIKLYDKIIEE